MRNTLERRRGEVLERAMRALASLALTACLAYIGFISYVYVAGYASDASLTLSQVLVFSAISIFADLWPAFLLTAVIVGVWLLGHGAWRRRSNKRIERTPQG
jgi:hypothetical protein